MSTITSLTGSDGITTANSMTKINTNFTNLNSDKVETSYLDTDTTLAANSDTKIPTQKAVKAYADAQGNVNASEVARGIVEEATDAEVTAGTATGSTGAKLFVTPAKLATRVNTTITNTATIYSNYQTVVVHKCGSATYDTATASGTQNIAHGLGTTPKMVRVYGALGAVTTMSFAVAVYNGTTTAACYGAKADTEEQAGATFRMSRDASGGEYAEAVVTADATNIILTWTKSGNASGTAYLTWEAQA